MRLDFRFSCVSLPKFHVRTTCMVLLNTNKIVLLLRTCFFLSFCHLMSNQYIPFVIYNALISTLYTPLFVPNISGFQSVSISLHQCPALNAMNPNKNITVRILCRYSQNTFHCKIFKQLLGILVSAPATEQITLDFETAVWAALKKVMPQAKLQGCMFHWTQAL